MPADLFIAWDQQPVKGRGGGPFLLGEPAGPVPYADPWQGLRCEHHGAGRAEWTPFLVAAERRDGQVRQRLLYPLPLIRSCCIADDFHRAAWWHDVDWALKLWGDLADPAEAEALASARGALLAELRDVIPKPTARGVRDFAAFREDRADEDADRDRANRAYWEAAVRGHQVHEEEVRAERPDANFRLLDLPPGASLAQVKARHRELAMLHHPDRGGDSAQFRRIQAAYERISAALDRRAGS